MELMYFVYTWLSTSFIITNCSFLFVEGTSQQCYLFGINLHCDNIVLKRHKVLSELETSNPQKGKLVAECQQYLTYANV